ncbi:MAG TPA: YkvA family protein [Reyranella sp.]|nr:YkvA family protein [Reyranella sp.]
MSVEANLTSEGSWDVTKFAREKERVRRSFWTKARRVALALPFAEDLLAAYYCAFDRQTPRHVQAALIGALAYFVLPFDVVPDMMPVLGFTDDAAVLIAAFAAARSHITEAHREKARAWLLSAQGENS